MDWALEAYSHPPLREKPVRKAETYSSKKTLVKPSLSQGTKREKIIQLLKANK